MTQTVQRAPIQLCPVMCWSWARATTSGVTGRYGFA
jgi:hypothetical protein